VQDNRGNTLIDGTLNWNSELFSITYRLQEIML